MRALLACLLLAACGGGGPVPSAVAQGAYPPIAAPNTTTQTEWTQYRNADIPLVNRSNAECWFGGRALTSSTNIVYVGGMKSILLAHWIVVMTPNGGGARLVMFDSGPTNIETVAEWFDSRSTPMVAGAYVNAQLNAIITSNIQHKYLGLQICGPAQVYSSVVEVVYGG